MVQSPRASLPTEPVLKTPYTQSRGAPLRVGDNVWLGQRTRGREGTVPHAIDLWHGAGLAQHPALSSEHSAGSVQFCVLLGLEER